MEHKTNNSGYLLIDKPVDWTSHDVVGFLRGIVKRAKLSDAKRPKVGHAGTLDPFATGLLIVGVGREATREIDRFKDMKKEYVATMRFGAVSDTQDLTGKIQETNSKKQISRADLLDVIPKFIGKQEQIPPMYSAKKVGGKKLYELARKGEEIERAAVEIEIFNIELLDTTPVIARTLSEQSESKGTSRSRRDSDALRACLPADKARNDSVLTATIRVECGPGTYIRTLCHDIGQALGVGAYCESLQRTRIGVYSVEDAIGPKELNPESIVERLFLQ